MAIRLSGVPMTKVRTERNTSSFRAFLQQWDLQIMVIPAMLLIIVFSYIPMWGVLMAFQDFNIFKGFSASPWVGFKHLSMFLNAPEFMTIMRNTLAISLLKFIFGFPAPIILAIMLNETRKQAFKRTIQTITYMPYFISWVVVAGFVFTIFGGSDGIINNLLISANLMKEPIEWMLDPRYFWGILVSTGIWKDAGFGAIIYLAAISGIDPSTYEAAVIDGANRIQRIFRITIPSITPVIIILMILQVGNILNAGFEDIMLLTNNGSNYALSDVSSTIDIYVYREGVINMRYSYATAAGLFKGVLSAVMLTLANAMSRRMGQSSLW